MKKQKMRSSMKGFNSLQFARYVLLFVPFFVSSLLAEWEPDQRLTFDPAWSFTSEDGKYCVGVGSGEVVHVVWMDERPEEEIYYKRSTDGGISWGPDTRLTDNGNNADNRPCIAVCDNQLHVVWFYEPELFNWEICYKNSTDGGVSWGPEIRLTNDPTSAQFSSVVASDANVHVVWHDNRSGSAEIYYKHSTDFGITWSADTHLTNADGSSFFASMAIADTVLHLVWTDSRDGNSNFEIYYKRDPTGNMGADEKNISWKIEDVRLKIRPNPFVFYTTVWGYEKETFVLYDISGKQVGTYKGNKIGADLSAGIYFVRWLDKHSIPVRIVRIK